MADIIPFHNEEENEGCCNLCDLSHEFTLYILDAVSNGGYDEVFNLVRQAVEESRKQTLIEFLQQEVENNIKILDHLHGYCDCEDEE